MFFLLSGVRLTKRQSKEKEPIHQNRVEKLVFTYTFVIKRFKVLFFKWD